MEFNVLVVLPILIVVAYGLLALVLTPAFKKSPGALGVTTLLGLAVAVFAVVRLKGYRAQTAGGLVQFDGFAFFFDLIILSAAILAVLAAIPYLGRMKAHHGEFYALVLLAVAGMMTMVGSENLLTIFLGLELLSVPLYVLAGFTRDRMFSIEAALKYFLLGAFSTGFILYGIAFTYGATGSLDLRGIAAALAGGTVPKATFALGIGLILVGFAFKIAAVPFHAWAPDVYQGAPTPVAGLMAAGTKAAAFGVLLRVVHTAIPEGAAIDWRSVVWVLAALTMTVANVIAIAQQNVKRLLAYSSIVHAGYLLIAVVSPIGGGVQSAAFYLVAYTFMTMGAFVVASIVGRGGGDGQEGDTLSAYAGLGRRRPILACAMTLFMLSLTGIPPTAGFIGKVYIFITAMDGKIYWLTAIALLNSVIAAYYYLGVVVAMWMQPETDAITPAPAGFLASTALVVASVGTVLFGVWPGPLLATAGRLALSLL